MIYLLLAPPDERPMTPTRLSRIDEKNALVGLNNRLAAIIDRNQQLESENSKLSAQVRFPEVWSYVIYSFSRQTSFNLVQLHLTKSCTIE
jgi:hypothetical protein